MAWITVDQKLIGGKLRDFAKRSGISQNEAVGILIRLWLWGIDNTEEDGKITAADHVDIEEAIRPGFLECDKDTLSMIVDNLIACGWIDLRDDEMYLHDWIDWRSYYMDMEKKRAKNAERMRNYRAQKSQEPTEEEAVAPDPEKEPEKAPDPPESEKKTTRKTYTPGFEEFWKTYPRKVEKGNAYKKYQARLNDGYSEEELLTAAQRYAKECQTQHTESRYIKHPKTFLSDAMPFLDYIRKHPGTQEAVQTAQNGADQSNPFARKNPFRR